MNLVVLFIFLLHFHRLFRFHILVLRSLRRIALTVHQAPEESSPFNFHLDLCSVQRICLQDPYRVFLSRRVQKEEPFRLTPSKCTQFFIVCITNTATPLSLHRCHHIVDLQHHVHVLRRLVDRTAAHQQRLDDAQVLHVRDAALLHIDAREGLASLVALSQLRHDANGVQSRIFRKCVRDDLQCLRVRAGNVTVRTGQTLDPLLELRKHLRFGRTTSDQKRGLFDQTANHAQRVVQRAVRLVQHLFITAQTRAHQIVRSAQKHRDGLSGVRHARDLRDAFSLQLHLLHTIRVTQLVLRETVDVGNGTTPQGLWVMMCATTYTRDEFDVVALDVGNHHDFELAEEVKRELVDSVAQNRLLHQNHVAARLLDLLAHLER